MSFEALAGPNTLDELRDALVVDGYDVVVEELENDRVQILWVGHHLAPSTMARAWSGRAVIEILSEEPHTLRYLFFFIREPNKGIYSQFAHGMSAFMRNHGFAKAFAPLSGVGAAVYHATGWTSDESHVNPHMCSMSIDFSGKPGTATWEQYAAYKKGGDKPEWYEGTPSQ